MVSNDYVELSVAEGILYVCYKKNESISLDAAKLIVDLRLAFSNGSDFPLLIYGEGIKSMTKEARNYLSGPDAQKGVKASAIIVNSVLESVIVNFFVNVNDRNKSFPVRIFHNKSKALTWLKKYR